MEIANMRQGALRTSNKWFEALDEELGWRDQQKSYRALLAVLHAVRDRLSPAEAIAVGEQLPVLIRGMYYEGWRLGKSASSEESGFVERIRSRLGSHGAGEEPEHAAEAVFRVMEGWISERQIEAVRQALPDPINSLLNQH